MKRVTMPIAASMLGLKPRTVQAMAARGLIPGAAKLGRLWTFDVERLRAWLQAQEREISTGGAPSGTVASLSQTSSIAARYKQLISARPSAA